ncbi:hypothetical protein [Desulfosediminicola ganghwensis]|uniref:hypothetical protein n=1 Tax=Desulfosediminicola ganghwensis TaxID=2569540 RepID=UPI0010AD3D43|nr:hypothetical protein [Desulfosediminicola ganghwensis]
MTPYDEAHLFIAATRILAHQKRCAPAIEDICELIGISVEAGHSLCRKLEQKGIVELFEDPFTVKVSVANHLEIENLPKKEAGNTLAAELDQFMSKKKDMDKKVETIQAELDAKKKKMFSELEKQFKKNTGDVS